MKKAPYFAMLVMIILFVSALTNAKTVKVFLLGGQSNMDGRAPASGLPTSPVNLQQEQTDVLFYQGNASGGSYLPGNTLIYLAPGSGSKSPSTPTFGPEVTFGRTMVDAYPQEQFALIKYALGGSKLATDWNPATGAVYTAFRDTVANGLSALTTAGYDYEIVGMLWMQGESDSTTTYANAYQSNLTAFIADIRSRYGWDIPFVIGETWRNEGDAAHPGPLGDIVSGAQQAIADSDPHVGFVSTRTFTFQDSYHLNASGQMNLGSGMADYLISNNLLSVSTPTLKAAQVLMLSPTDDSYIRISDTTTSSHGSEPYMITNNGTSSGKLRWSFVKFDLSSITEPIIGVKLEIQATSIGGSTGVLSHAVYGLTTGDNWTEATLNYTNAPARNGNAIDMTGVYGGQALNTFDYDGTARPVFAAIDQPAGGPAVDFVNTDSDKITTFIIARTGTPSDGGIGWATKESGTAYPGILQALLTVYTGVVNNPDPANGQGLATDPESPLFSGVTVDQNLSWQLVNDPNIDTGFPVEYRLYIDPNRVNVEAGAGCQYFSDFSSGALYDPAVNLDYETEYYWRVDTRLKWNDRTEPNIIAGSVWEFKTVTELPTITADPENTKVKLTETANLTVSYESISAITAVTWFKDGVAVSNDSNHTVAWNQTSSTLTITNAGGPDFGSYYCVVQNGSRMTMSASAMLAEKKLLAWYKFEQNANDSVGTNNGIAVPNMAYSEGWVGSYAADPNGANYVLLSTDAYPKAGFGNGLDEFTDSCWVKLAPGEGGVVLGTFNDDSSTGLRFSVNGADNDISVYLRQEGGSSINPKTALLDSDSQWHYVAATYDGLNMIIYVDGVERTTATNALTNFSEWQYPVTLLAKNGRGDIQERFDGQVDDLRIYNYSLSKEEIAQAYYDITGKPSCILDYASTYDISGPDSVPDCVIDLYDFVEMAAVWMKTGLYPSGI